MDFINPTSISHHGIKIASISSYHGSHIFHSRTSKFLWPRSVWKPDTAYNQFELLLTVVLPASYLRPKTQWIWAENEKKRNYKIHLRPKTKLAGAENENEFRSLSNIYTHGPILVHSHYSTHAVTKILQYRLYRLAVNGWFTASIYN